MVRTLIDLWYKNEHNIKKEDLINSLKPKDNLYSELSFLIGRDILNLENIKIIKTKPWLFHIEGIFTEENNLKYKVIFKGELHYGSCELCDLTMHLINYGQREKEKALKLVMLNIIQKAKIDIEFLPNLKDKDIQINILQKWGVYSSLYNFEEINESFISILKMTIESNKFFFEDEGNYDDYDFLKQELIEELYLKEKLRDYDFTIYLIFYKYLELLGEDLNNEFLKSILSNNWTKESINSLYIGNDFIREYPIRNLLKEYKKIKKEQFNL